MCFAVLHFFSKWQLLAGCCRSPEADLGRLRLFVTGSCRLYSGPLKFKDRRVFIQFTLPLALTQKAAQSYATSIERLQRPTNV